MTKLAEKISGSLCANPFKFTFPYQEKYKENNTSIFQFKSQPKT